MHSVIGLTGQIEICYKYASYVYLDALRVPHLEPVPMDLNSEDKAGLWVRVDLPRVDVFLNHRLF